MKKRLFGVSAAVLLTLSTAVLPAQAAPPSPTAVSVQVSNTTPLVKKGTVLYRCRKWNWFWGWMEVLTADRVSAEKNGYVCYQCVYRP